MSTAINQRFLDQHVESANLSHEALELFPSGITHDIRAFKPFPIYIDHATGSRKWDVDGNEIIDYVMGHGALLFGHANPILVKAITKQISLGTHYGGSSDAEIRWAQVVQSLIPSARKIRFTSSGTEATMLAVRLARAFTGRDKLLKLRDHFHGWNDSLAAESSNTSGGISSTGLPSGLKESITIIDQNNRSEIASALNSGLYAAAICEPSGYHWGTAPLDVETLALLREKTSASDTILIFDEVITGFRASPGGMQGVTGIHPDLTTLAKILAGGLPGGAVAGDAQLLDQISFQPDGSSGANRIAHPGTYNANPLSAAAGIAALKAVATGEPNRIADERAKLLCNGLNQVIRQSNVSGAAYGYASMLHIVLNESVSPPEDGFNWEWQNAADKSKVPETNLAIRWPFRQALMNHGVDLMGMGAQISCVHSERDIYETIDAFAATLSELRQEDII